jgi:hypothetical protein
MAVPEKLVVGSNQTMIWTFRDYVDGVLTLLDLTGYDVDLKMKIGTAATKTFTMTLLTQSGSTLGQAKYKFADADIDAAGAVQFQAVVKLGPDEYPSEIEHMTVLESI